MAFDIIPSTFWNWPSFRLPSAFAEDEDWAPAGVPSGLSLSEDDHHVYITAALPGVAEDDIDITYNKGVLWIKGDVKDEEMDAKRKYYRKASSSFSYRVAVPGDIDAQVEPDASYKNGIMTVTFTKSASAQPKKIQVKKGK